MVRLVFAVTILFSSWVLAAQETVLSAKQLPDKNIEVTFNIEKSGIRTIDLKSATLYRTTSNMMLTRIQLMSFENDLEKPLYPVFKRDLFVSLLNRPFIDEFAADNTTYFYVLKLITKSGKISFSNVAQVTTENKILILTGTPTIFVDKEHYILEIMHNGRTAKRYPIILGENPIDRKIHSDFATTPEGIYKVSGIRPNATYYKAYDINYPNAVDRYRYALATKSKKLPEIGGNIQIHGKSTTLIAGPLDINWTWGCMSLRNTDMDEIFSTKMIAIGNVVAISGKEITRDDMESMLSPRGKSEYIALQTALKDRGFYKSQIDGKMTPETMKALCDFQAYQQIPITCGLDLSTLDELGAQ